MSASADCELKGWLSRTGGNTAARRIVVAEPWSGMGLGHTVMGSSSWLELASRGNRSLRFAYCVPASFQRRLRFPDAAVCESAHWDLHRFIGVDGAADLRAASSDFAAIKSFRRRSAANASVGVATRRM